MRHLLFFMTTVALAGMINAQVKTISLKKGEALDLLLLNTNAEAKEELNEYFAEAVPIAQKWGYKPQYSSRISVAPTQGNYWPSTFIIAKWEDYDKRIQFTEDIIKEYPLFHQRRREIWPTFNLTYWKVEEDQEILIHPDKFYIATSYWGEEEREFGEFSERLEKEVDRKGGKVVLEFRNGTSPFGYRYNPDLFTIVEWESKEDFEKFYEKNTRMDHAGVAHVNQFIRN